MPLTKLEQAWNKNSASIKEFYSKKESPMPHSAFPRMCDGTDNRIILQKALVQGYINPGYHVSPATKLYVVTPNMCGSSVCNLLHVTFLVPESLRWLQHFWKIC